MKSKKEFKMEKEESYKSLLIKCKVIMIINKIKEGLSGIKNYIF